ncbi:translation initiation factor 2 [Actinoplanes sp. GCM10030250]|uniref:translation initiation factor 2 n=1 Tax=Actinoplanes sp. GCM10030250 TaxID=3273376 RepID=UPI00362010A7
MSSPTSPPDDDAYWQRPDPTAESLGRPARSEPPVPEPLGYAGPPRADPPIAGWRPPTIAHPPPPRSMPGQDIDALEESEGSARTVTYGIGLVTGAIAVVLMCLLCSRFLF